jgi:hypothetical protein
MHASYFLNLTQVHICSSAVGGGLAWTSVMERHVMSYIWRRHLGNIQQVPISLMYNADYNIQTQNEAVAW